MTPSTALRAGAAAVEITPPAGVQIAGSVGIHRPAQTVLDPTFARAAVFELGSKRICIVSLDVTIITAEYTRRIRAAAQTRCGIEPGALMVHATQTHSAPPIGKFMVDDELFDRLTGDLEWLSGGEASYSDAATERAIEAVEKACRALEPVELGYGRAVRPGLAGNRRAIRLDGQVGMPFPVSSMQRPLGRTEYRAVEGPDDPEVGVVALRTAALAVPVVLLHFTSHPVAIYAQGLPVISADWCGAWVDATRKRHGDRCTPLVINGCCGNINPWPPLETDFRLDHEHTGRELGAASQSVIERLTFAPVSSLDFRTREIRLPIREDEPARLDEAKRFLDTHPHPLPREDDPNAIDPRWVYAASKYSVELLRRREGALRYEVQALRLGDVGVVGLPGEPFVEGQIRLKVESPAKLTLVAHCCTSYAGYLPTRDAYARGGHEVDGCAGFGGGPTYWNQIAPGGLETAIDTGLDLLREMF